MMQANEWQMDAARRHFVVPRIGRNEAAQRRR